MRRALHVFGYDDAPHGHAEVTFDHVEVDADAMLLGEGRGFEIAQGRLGPGRIHHCMRTIGLAERALSLACARASERKPFGSSLDRKDLTVTAVAECRLEIDQALTPRSRRDRAEIAQRSRRDRAEIPPEPVKGVLDSKRALARARIGRRRGCLCSPRRTRWTP